MSLQSIPKITRQKEIEVQLCLAWDYIEWIEEHYPEIYDEFIKDVE